jgi:REP-associated tyrosine transposase
VVTVRTRGRLPHWEAPGAVYFVTFRLADSLPKSVLRDIRFTRQETLRIAQAQNRSLSPDEARRLARLLRSKIETHLDAGAGSCLLRNPGGCQHSY